MIECCNRGETFHSKYTLYQISKVLKNHIHRHTYKNWSGWYFKKGSGLYCFEKGYDEDYAKKVKTITKNKRYRVIDI